MFHLFFSFDSLIVEKLLYICTWISIKSTFNNQKNNK